MIYLSAQPDDYYFLWQLELQLYNFNKLGIASESIHVLIGYDRKIGVKGYFRDFMMQNKERANFFVYPDLRARKAYLSSIRPHIIKQHIKAFPELEKTIMFYHDSDVIFRDLPRFVSMLGDNCWYVSDARSYLDIDYIKKKGSEELFCKMCQVVGISPDIVLENNDHVGGAQYLLKKTTYDFWDKVEHDCEALYELLQNYSQYQAELAYLRLGQKVSAYNGIKAWYADMWAVLWNAWDFGHKVMIHRDLDFCWPYQPIKVWKEKKLLHYSGVIDKKSKGLFRKSNFVYYAPYYEVSLHEISNENCSYPLRKLIEEYEQQVLTRYKTNLCDFTFLIPVRIDSEDRLKNLEIITRFLYKHFHTQIIILESDITSRLKNICFPPICRIKFLQETSPYMHRTRINNHLVRMAETKFIVIYDTDVVLSPRQIIEAVTKLREEVVHLVTPYDGKFIEVDRLFKAMFDKLLDVDLLLMNRNKFIVGTHRSRGGAAFLNRQSYIKSGMENEYINSWGPEDVERVKRLEILGYKTARINGPLFHLPHERRLNSGYTNRESRVRLMEEYLRICNMKKEELKQYISVWPWLQ